MTTTEVRSTSPAPATGLPSRLHDDIERCRLDHLYARAAGRMIRLLAPAGYGKTSLAARWVAGERRPVRWVDLTDSHDDPVALFADLRSVLAGLVDIRPPAVEHAASSSPYLRAVEDGLGRPVRPVPFVLVLDDVHHVRSEAAQSLIRGVAEKMPSGSTVVLIGRGHHDNGTLARLRLSPGVVDVMVDDLAFERSESFHLLESLGIDTASPRVADVVRELEGWPAGVRLAGRVLQADPDVQGIADHVGLVDYLRSEWTAQVSAEELRFLREVACLQRFTGVACDDVLGRTGCAATLQQMHRDRVLVFALDQRDDEYRMHGLLTRWLSGELRDLDPDRWAEIHHRAAAYREREGDIDRAVDHLVRLGDLDALEQLVVTHGGAFFTRGLESTVDRWLSAFSAERLRASPGLCGLQSIKELHAGNDAAAVQWMRLLDAAVAELDGNELDSTRWWSNVLHAALDEAPAAGLLAVVAPARVHLRGGPWAGFACWVEGALNFVVGNRAEAEQRLDEGAFEADLVGSPLIIGHCRATSAIIADCAGDFSAAARHDDRAQEMVVACGGELLPPAALVMASSALRRARCGDSDVAAHRLAVAHRTLAGFSSVAPWFNIISRIALVRTALLLDDRESAQRLLRELDHHAAVEPSGEAPPTAGALACLAALHEQVGAMHLPATGATALTEAERRVLQLLPTNLSLGDIADQLYISRNTVKSHVGSIYRKTGATKRTDAVERARAAGLLPPPTR